MIAKILSDKLRALYPKLFSEKGNFQIYGLDEGGRDGVLASLLFHQYENQTRALLFCESEKRCQQLYEMFSQSHYPTLYFPANTYTPYGILSQSDELIKQRQAVLARLLFNKRPYIVVTTLSALAEHLMPESVFRDSCLNLKTGDVVDRKIFLDNLIQLGYERTSKVDKIGDFAVRGDIIDIFPLGYEHPIRLDFFDDELESFSFFDVMDQRTLEKGTLTQIKIIPAISIVGEDFIFEKMIDSIQEDIEAISEIEKMTDSSEQHLLSLLGKLKNHQLPQDMDNLLPYAYDKRANILDYLSDDVEIILDDLTHLEERFKNNENEQRNQFKELATQGYILPKQETLFLKMEDIQEKFKEHSILALNYLNKQSSFCIFENQFYISGENLIFKKGDWGRLAKQFSEWLKEKNTLILAYQTGDQRKKFEGLLNQYELNFKEFKPGMTLENGKLYLVEDSLDFSYKFHDIKIIFIHATALLEGEKRSSKKRSSKDKSLSITLEDLEIGDYIVHEAHGIGIYAGVEHIVAGEREDDYIILQYKGSDRLMVPVTKIDNLRKYQGQEGKIPKVSNLNSKEWIKTKAKVQGKVEEIAKELLRVSAERKLKDGFAFSPDTDLQIDFENSFPYIETPDQLTAIADVKRDMEASFPMDRLICGDVGYGKTEVAMRAAFKAVMDHKQVAILVPTTVLCQQHFQTFHRRMADFGVEVAQLSRFTSTKESKVIKEKIKNHEIDIIIGTHKILSGDMEYADLGLLVIDEEQRFGVKQKEMIKALKTTVDVLTLSATPIPRTLHISMVGIRDVSIIETPPQNRYPIQTYIIEHNLLVLTQAIQRELSRGGQIYYVRNRVEELETIAAQLKSKIPDLRIGIIHGKMTESKVDKIMLQFLNKEIDLLVCTTIIETGLDISNVNTLIVEYADTFGLSQLYQLRGRVGRSDRTAYAYFTYDRGRVLTVVAEKRLMTLQQYTALGSGFKIAKRDLELRGSGNILGKEQSGQMLAVGFDLYMHLLGEAIAKMKGNIQKDIEPEINIRVNAFIPENYISEVNLKLNIYQRISRLNSLKEISIFKDELEDRFGKIPIEVIRLLDVARLKLFTKKSGIEKIDELSDRYTFSFMEDKIHGEEAERLIQASRQGLLNVQFTEENGKTKLIYKKTKEKEKNFQGLCQQIYRISTIVNYEK